MPRARQGSLGGPGRHVPAGSPRRGRGRPVGLPGLPPPARRAGPSRPARLAGAARGRHWACSDGGQVAPRASFRAARTRDVPGRPAPPDAAGTGRRDPSGPGAGCGVIKGGGRARRRPAPTHPQERSERAGGLADAAAPGSRCHVGAGRGRPCCAHLAGPGREGAGRAGWGSLPSGLWDAAAAARRGRALRPGLGRTRPAELAQPGTPEGPAPPRPRPPAPRGRTARGAARPSRLSPGESASRFSKMAFPGPGTNSSANKSSLFRGRYGMIYQVPAARQLQ